MVGDPLLPAQEESLITSRIVHVSVDPATPRSDVKSIEEQSDEMAVDPDKVITSARPAILSDGLLTVPELCEFFSRLPPLRSVYDEGLGLITDVEGLSTFGGRVELLATRKGRNEPEYTSYTHYWKNVLGEVWFLIT